MMEWHVEEDNQIVCNQVHDKSEVSLCAHASS